MEFLTLHELSLQLDVSVRVLRHRLRQLLAEGKLVENLDCRRDDFVDDTHFVWRVDRAVFLRVTGLSVVTQPATQPLPTVNPSGPAVTHSVNSSATQPAPSVAHVAAPVTQTPPPMEARPPGMEREMIDLLKDQVRVKDGQISDLTYQSKTLTALNEKLTGVVVHQSDQIRNLLRLTGGKTEWSELVTQGVNQSVNRATHGADKPLTEDDELGNQAAGANGEQGSARAA